MPKGNGARKPGEPFELGAELRRRDAQSAVLIGGAIELPDGVKRCARCGRDHLVHLRALPLERGVGCMGHIVATHFFFCPINGQPVLVISTPSEVVTGESFEVYADLQGGLLS